MAVTTGAALLGSAILGVGGSIYAGKTQGDSAKQAAKQGGAWQMQALDRQLQVAAPTMRIGYGAQKQLAELYGIDPSALLPWETPAGPAGAGTASGINPQQLVEIMETGTGKQRKAAKRIAKFEAKLASGNKGPATSARLMNKIARQERKLGPLADPVDPKTGQPIAAPGTPGGGITVGRPNGPVGATAAGPPSFVPASEDPRLRNFFTSPGYGWRVGEGVKALDRGAAGKGGLYSGAQMKAITRFGQNYGSNEYGQWLAGLQSLAGQGITAGAGYGDAVGRSGSDLARIYGNSAYARGSAYADMARGVGDAIGGGISDWIYARERGLI